MKNQKFLRSISLVLAVIMAMAMLVACKPNTPPSAEEEKIPMPTEDLKIADGGNTSYKVIRAERAERYEIVAAQNALNGINEKAGLQMTMAEDLVDADLGITAIDTEILVGRTNRAESIQVYNLLRADDFVVTVINKKVVIAAHTEEKLNEAVVYFIDKLQASGGSATFVAADAKHSAGTYEVESVKVNGVVLSKYRIVYMAGSEGAVKAGAEKLSADLAASFGYKLQVVNDNTEESQYEIVFGETNRGDSAEIFRNMGTKNYSASIKDGKIYIIPGADSSAPEAAVDGFIGKLAELCVDKKAELTADNFSLSFESTDFATRNITLNGVSISDYTIIYSGDDLVAKKLAERVQKVVSEVAGRRVNITSDSKAYAGGKEILLGYSKRCASGTPAEAMGKAAKALSGNNMLMYSEGDFFFMGGKSGNSIAILAATNRLINAIKDVSNAENHEISFDLKEAAKPEQTKYKVMTYNDGDNRWRNPSMNYRVSVIKEFNPDIVGMQEVERQHAQPANPIQLNSSYKKLLPEYGIVYYDHEDPILTVPYGNMILYKTDKFELLDSGVQWLSDTPDVPNSMYDATDYVRTYVYAILKDKATGEEIVFISTHVDYVKEANTPQMHALIKCTEKFRDRPIIFTGDFNMQRYWDGFKAMYDAGYVESGLYMDPMEAGHIDFIFSDPSQMITTYYKCINDHKHSAGKPQAGSDHHPYVADLVIAH